MTDDIEEDDIPSSGCCQSLGIYYQLFLDRSVPELRMRWFVLLMLNIIYLVRVLHFIGGFHIITYGLAIYYLNLFIAFLSPKIDPAFAEFEEYSLYSADDEEPTLPTTTNEEFRPFIRRLPEFKFWLAATKGALVALICTSMPFLDVPVFWPILVIYFFMLFCVTMKRQIRHMVRYRYVPFSYGKARYEGKSESPRVMDM